MPLSPALLFFFCFFFFFNDPATTEIYTLSLHDALPIFQDVFKPVQNPHGFAALRYAGVRSEEHTSELQSHSYLVCRLLLEKKKRILLLMGNIISQRWLLSRRHFLRGLGATLALPLLDAMTPLRATAAAVAEKPRRCVFVYI